MDVLCNGDEREKNEFSFRLIDQAETGTISSPEFHQYFTQMVMHCSYLINSHVHLEEDTFRKVFDQIDLDHNGQITIREYHKALKRNPDLLDWFAILNQSSNNSVK